MSGHHPERPILLALLAVLAAGPRLLAQDHSGVYPRMDIQNGALLYGANCAQCHGATGDGIPGVDLKAGIRRVSTDEQLAQLIVTGIPGTAMPATPFGPPEAMALVAYLRSMRDFNAPAVMVGDAARGRALFEGKGACTSCHRVQATGSRVAPDLSDIGATRAADAIWHSLLDPTSAMRPINRPLKIVTKDGRTINGRRLNEDTYSLQIIDDQEHLLSLMKSDLRSFTVIKTSTMPSYKDKLTSQETADIVSYLVSLKGLI
ncbi:MAG TPA: c-type cytochrome [Vicinamibacterales bacterium]|jgi:putative heme-binding domain-containing protein|nr:c-type cytochrome [Vicinamibacterales bacterium]